MGTYVKLSEVGGLRAPQKDIYQCDSKVKRFFKSSKLVGTGKESLSVSHVGFSPVGNLASICAGTKVIFYNYASEEVVYTYHNAKEFLRCCSLRSDGKVAAVSDDGGWIQLIALELRSNLKKWRAHQAPCHAHMFSSGKTRLMTGGDDGIAKYWDTVTGELVQDFKFHSDKIRTLTDFHGSESMWVTGGYDSIGYVFDVRDSSKPMAKVEHGSPIEFVELSSVNNLLLTAGGNCLKLWDMSNGLQLMYSFEPHQRTIVRGYIRDSILTASLDGTVRYFNHPAISQGCYASYKEGSSFYAMDGSNGDEASGLEEEDVSQSGREERSISPDVDFSTPLGSTRDSCNGDKAAAPKGPLTPTNKVRNGSSPQDDGTEFLTPENDITKAPDTVYLCSGTLASTGGEKRMHSQVEIFDSARSSIASPRRIRKTKDIAYVNEESTGERSVTLRHVYRFGEAITAFAVSVDAKAIAVGLASGEWIIRYNEKGIVEREHKPRKAIKVVENVLEYKTVKLTLLDRLVKTFQYQAAMDLALSLSPEHVYNLVETLILRGSLATAVRGKDEQTILPLLKFLSSHMGSDINNTSSHLELAHAVLDNNEWLESCNNDNVIQELRKIPTKINFELFQHNILQTLKGSLDLILSQQGHADDIS